MTAGLQNFAWLPPGSTVVTVIDPMDLDEQTRLSKFQADPNKVWTLNGLLRSPSPRPTGSITLPLEQAAGGTLGMAGHDGTLYLSEWAVNGAPTQQDMHHALRLGWLGSIAPLLFSWQQQGER